MMETLPMSEVHFDANGLIPVVVQEACSGKVLMLAYMNEESLRKTLETGETWYYSRSRRELWHKGETSGHFQKVLAISVDCDADTLLIQVDQTGAACHTGNKSCFFRALEGVEGDYAGSLAVLSDLKDEISEKHAHPTEKSYTAYLRATGIDKIGKKIGEESSEVIIGAKNLVFEGEHPQPSSDLLAAPTAQPRNGFGARAGEARFLRRIGRSSVPPVGAVGERRRDG